jgi:diaminopimelate decarboxylase
MDLDREIEEIRAEAKRQVAESINAGYGEGIAYGRSSMACKALLVIEELKKEFETSLEIQRKLRDIIHRL